ncbi:ATP synthase F1 subunit delta [Chryseolinea sp. H1M3-3]|uniref:ATP synthase F1 subunit delta n=1 Tax=Chryseolinea sp. H1M3-3 TaxID=3034144 RepID=UPI0023ECC31B|nr:ATP synthase F1 subunit delta [Chryseolinea sp. H1M3-3]
MADIKAVSRYVKSLLNLAVEKGALEQVHQDMLAFDKVLSENRALITTLRSPIIKHYKKKNILEALFRGRFNELTLSFFRIITEKNREGLLPQIAKEFHHAYNEHQGIGRASVVTAVPIDNELREQILAVAKKVVGKTKVELKEEVDPSIIGGFILNAGSQQIDSSIKHKLRILQLNFSNNRQLNK